MAPDPRPLQHAGDVQVIHLEVHTYITIIELVLQQTSLGVRVDSSHEDDTPTHIHGPERQHGLHRNTAGRIPQVAEQTGDGSPRPEF